MNARWILVVVLATSSAAASAAGNEDWEFVYVNRSSNLEVRTGSGNLSMTKARLQGKLLDDRGTAYYFNGKRRGAGVKAHFGAVESDDGGSLYEGVFYQLEFSSAKEPDYEYCAQTIRLSSIYHTLTLARNVSDCD